MKILAGWHIRSLSKITFGGNNPNHSDSEDSDYKGNQPVTMESSMTGVNFSGEGLTSLDAMIMGSFLPKW